MATVRDIAMLALPNGGRVIAGEAGLDREACWVCTIRSYPPLPDDLGAGDCALLAATPSIFTEEAQIALFEELVALDVAAAVVIGDAPGRVLSMADAHHLPVLSMPQGTRLNEAEKAIAAFIFNRQAELEQRGVQIYRQMAQMVTAGRGIGAIIDQLAEITGKMVTLQNADFNLRFQAGPLPAEVTLDELSELLHDGRELREWLEGIGLVSTAPPITQIDLPVSDLSRFVAPVIVRESIVGYVSVLSLKPDLTELDRVATGRAASVCAIEMAKERAVVEAEEKVRGDLVEDLLTGFFLTEEAAIRRGAALGYDLTAPYLVVAIKLDGPTGPVRSEDNDDVAALGRIVRYEMPHRVSRSLIHLWKDAVIILWPVSSDDIKRLKSSIDSLRRYVASALSTNISAGIGRPCFGPRDVPRAYLEASQALGVAQNLLGGSRTSYFDDLLVHRLLLPLQGSRELSAFYDDSVGQLVAYDRRHQTELVKTLTAFFAAHGNINRTAERLYLHRNAVAYRLKRIEAISGLSLDDPEHRLALQLGLKVKDIV